MTIRTGTTRSYAAANDYLILMAYDQHWTGSDAGPVAAQDWFEQNLVNRMRDLDPAKTIIALGNYGYDWSDADNEAEEVTFQEALITARESEARSSFDPDVSQSILRIRRRGRIASQGLVSRCGHCLQPDARGEWLQAGRVLRSGDSDPKTLQSGRILGRVAEQFAPTCCRRIVYGYQVDFEGTGELLKVMSRPQDGWRNLELMLPPVSSRSKSLSRCRRRTSFNAAAIARD